MTDCPLLQPGDAAPGVETLAVVNTPLDRAHLYFAHRPPRVLLAADADAPTHRAYGFPAVEFVQDAAGSRWPVRVTMQEFQAVLIDPTRELPAPRSPFEANIALNGPDGFRLTEADERIMAAHGMQLAGPVLIDRQGIVR